MAKSPCATRPVKWVFYATHHPIFPWGQRAIESTKGKRSSARYKRPLNNPNIEQIDLGFHTKDEQGDFKLHQDYVQIIECFLYYRKMGYVIGASNGKETEYVLIKWSERGEVHGRPVTPEEIKRIEANAK